MWYRQAGCSRSYIMVVKVCSRDGLEVEWRDYASGVAEYVEVYDEQALAVTVGKYFAFHSAEVAADHAHFVAFAIGVACDFNWGIGVAEHESE